MKLARFFACSTALSTRLPPDALAPAATSPPGLTTTSHKKPER